VIGIRNLLLSRFILAPLNTSYLNLLVYLIIIMTAFCVAPVCAQSTNLQVLPPLGCPSNGSAGVLGWINNEHTALGCINGVNTDGNGGLILNGGISTPILTNSGNAIINGSVSIGGAIQIGSSNASCSLVNQGTIQYNKASQMIIYCNGTAWTPMQGSSSKDTTTGTTSPSLVIPMCNAGQFLTSTDGKMLMCQ